MEHSIEWLILKHLSAAADWPKVFFSAILSHTQRREMVLYIQFVVCVAMMTSCFISTLFENYSKCLIWILAFSTKFCPIKTDLSGNTVWPQASAFQKLAKMDQFWHFFINFCLHSKCKRNWLRSQCWMRLFLWFSNTVHKMDMRTWSRLEKSFFLLIHSVSNIISKGLISILLRDRNELR